MYRKIISIFTLSAFVSYLMGCTSMRYLPRDQLSNINQKQSLWVTLADGSQYEIKKPQVKGTQLTGYFGAEGYREINLSQVASISIKKVNVGKTLLIGTVGFVATIFFISALTSGSTGGNSEST